MKFQTKKLNFLIIWHWISLFLVTAVISLIVAMIVINLICKSTKMKALMGNLALNKGVGALTDKKITEHYCECAM